MPNRISFSPVTGDFVDPAYPIDEVFGVELAELEQEDVGVGESVELLGKSGIDVDYLPAESNGYLLHFEAGTSRFICPRGPMADWMIQWLEAMFKSLGPTLFDATGIVRSGSDLATGRMWIEVDWYADHYLPLMPKDSNNLVSTFEKNLEKLTGILDKLAQYGAVHGDIRPEFLFVRSGSEQLRLIGFGLGLMVAAQREAVFSGLGTSIGDPRTMAPEVVAGALPTAQSDSYSAAAALLWAIGLVDPVRHSDTLFGTEAMIAREALKPSDWIGRGMDQVQRDLLIEKVSKYLDPEISMRRTVVQEAASSSSGVAQSSAVSLWQRLKLLFSRSEKPELAAPAKQAPKERIQIPKKIVMIGIVLAIPVFGVGVFVRAKLKKTPPEAFLGDRPVDSSHNWHGSSSSSTRHSGRNRKVDAGEDPASNPAASVSASPMMNLDPEKCKKELTELSRKAEAELQFWGDTGGLILCSSRDGRSLFGTPLLHVQGCALNLNQRLVIEVFSTDDSQMRVRTEAMQKEALWCGIGAGVVHAGQTGKGRRSVSISLATRTGGGEDG